MSNITIPIGEVTYLRELAARARACADSDAHAKKRRNWTKLNDLEEGVKPLFINHYWPNALREIFPEDSYTCTTEKGKYFENYLKTKLFYAETLQDDNVIEPVLPCPMIFDIKDYKDITREVSWSKHDSHGETAYEIIPVIRERDDINKLTEPVLAFDKVASEKNFREAQEIFEPMLRVIKKGITFAAKIPDEYSWLRGLENTYTDMYDDPEWMHEALKRITENFKKRFTLIEEAGLWGTLDESEPLGSAGLRYATGIPDFRDVKGKDYFNHKVKLADSWGFTCAEVFHCVSSDMHNTFGFEYDKEVVSLFKYMNVGCCEVLDKKMELVRSIANTRKVSVAEWCDVEHAAKEIQKNHVYSYRAAGVHFVPDQWDKAAAEKELRAVLEASKKYNCNTEIVLNIGGSLGNHATQKAVEWSTMTRELIDEYYA